MRTVRPRRDRTALGSAGVTSRARPERPLLLVAATGAELEPLCSALREVRPRDVPGWPGGVEGSLDGRAVVLARCGVGKASAAGAVSAYAADVFPSAVLMTGIAGAYVGAFVAVGAVVCAASEFDLDAGLLGSMGMASLAEVPLALVSSDLTGAEPAYQRFATDADWTERLAAACGTVPVGFASSDAISADLDVAAERAARSGAAVESMEGAGAALVCVRLGLPFAEVRGVSNVAGVRDKQAWDVPTAIRAAGQALRTALRRDRSG